MTHKFEIEKSALGARWRLPDHIDDRAIMLMQQQHNVPELLARLLISRKIDPAKIDAFLYPKLARDFPDPFALTGMDAAARNVATAIAAGKTIGVFADFDVDGATSSALMVQFLRALNIPHFVHIPDRMEEGYGPNVPALLGLQSKGCALAILCDCGTTAHDVLQRTHDANFPVIVLDHHEPEGTLPPATHVINPKRTDDTSGYTMLAAVGVTFLFCVAVNKILREMGYFNGRDEPPLKDYLDLVALGTLCDMVPLTGPNRMLVRFGLTTMAARKNIGIAALAKIAKIEDGEKITPMQIGFGLGPRINAGSRVHQADLGCRLLSSIDPVEAMRLAEILDDCNTKRREIETATVASAIKQVEDKGLDQHAVIVVDHPEWHPGVAGLVATRLKDRYGKPTCVVTYAKRGDGTVEARGSGRSVPGFNIAALFQGARAEGHVTKGGGHAMAGGFSLPLETLDAFKNYVATTGAKMAAGLDPTPERLADGFAFVRAMQVDVARILDDNLGPYGPGHDEPLFILPNARIVRIDVLNGSHVRAVLSDWEGGGSLKAMAFRAAESEMGKLLLSVRDRPVHLLGTLRVDRWQGRETPVFFIQDASLPGIADQSSSAA